MGELLDVADRAVGVTSIIRPPIAFGWMSKRPVPHEVMDGWLRPALSQQGIRRDLLKYQRAVDKRDTLEAAERLRSFDRPIEKNYPPGFFGVTPYVGEAVGQWGHNQFVWSGEAADGNQMIGQSDASKGLSADGWKGWPGPNVSYTMGWSFNNIDWPTWMGLVPGVRPIDEFPGYGASAYEVIQWYAKVCSWWYDMPLIIPITCIATELAGVIDPNRTGSIWDLPGYANAVDHDSYGQHQQREMYYPCPWNFQTAAWSFLTRIDKVLGSDAYPDGEDPDAVGELIQEALICAYPDAYREDYDWARRIIDEATEGLAGNDVESEPPKPEPPEYIAICHGADGRKWLEADGQDTRGGRLERDSDGHFTVYRNA